MAEKELSLSGLIAELQAALAEHGDAPLRHHDNDTGWEMPYRPVCLEFFKEAPVPYYLLSDGGYGSHKDPIVPLKEQDDG